jgi:pimeloyl-ACP methyl ester carboxylesterase
LGVEPAYTLVGHSIGAMYARLLAADRPGDVGALVLVDPAHEDLPEAVVPGMPKEAWSQWMARRQHPNPDGIREVDLSRHARRSRLPDVPVTVISAMKREEGPGWNTRLVTEATRRVHASLLDGIRVQRHVPASESGPMVHLEAPDLVAREIARIVPMTTGPRR